jgi:hypothetical protein
MPVVTKPGPGQQQHKNDKVFQWNMQGVFYITSKVTVGHPPPLVENVYPGSPKNAPVVEDRLVNHPGGNKWCNTRVKYQKQPGGGWFTDGSPVSNFQSTG